MTANVPELGTKGALRMALEFKRDPIGFLQNGIAACGDIFSFRPFGLRIIMVNHPDYIRHILVDHADRYDKDAMIFRIVRPVLRNGLISNADMELWRRQRRMMAPHFTPRTVQNFANNMTDEALAMLHRWGRRGDGQELDITDEIGQLALRIVNRSLFSADVSESARAFGQDFDTANNILGDFFRFPFPPLTVPTPRHVRLRRTVARMDAFVSTFIEQRLSEPETSTGQADLLSLLLHAVDEEDGQGMDIEQLHHEVLNLCIGAYETTTNALSWALYLLARHPQVEERLHAEVDQVVSGPVPTFEDIPKLEYTRMIVDETLRVYSPAYQSMRHANADDLMDGYHVPAGSNILINSYLLHRHPDFWDDPETFRPERFTPAEIERRPRHAYVPFGSGQRVCIGKHFALTELVLVLAMIARKYRMTVPPGREEVRPDPLITLHPRGGIQLRPVLRPGAIG